MTRAAALLAMLALSADARTASDTVHVGATITGEATIELDGEWARVETRGVAPGDVSAWVEVDGVPLDLTRWSGQWVAVRDPPVVDPGEWLALRRVGVE